MNIEQITSIARLIQEDSAHVATRVASMFGVSRQAASAQLNKLKLDGWISVSGTGRGVRYTLLEKEVLKKTYSIAGLSEDVVWRECCAPLVKDLPENVRNIWHHGLTEMINNAIDHSGSDAVDVLMWKNALLTGASITDQGEGIFLKIQKALNLYDPRESILELAKGKFTTDPKNHSGEGIFFSSKMFDQFSIASGTLYFMHKDNGSDFLLEEKGTDHGTSVYMQIDNDSKRTTKEVFDRFALPDEFTFAKTIVPVKLAQHEGEKLVSRSQAKRLTRRFDKFQTVILDFTDVEEIGQGFADEVFRVFQSNHPKITMTPIRMTASVKAMIDRIIKTAN